MLINEKKEAIVKAINDLYILQRFTYIEWNHKKGTYGRITYYKDNLYGKSTGPPLTDSIVKKHIDCIQTIGVYARYMKGIEDSKFICFDVDIGQKDKTDKQEKKNNMEKAKWVTYKIVHTMQEIGIDDDFIHISFSGGKGYHIEIFFDSPIEVSLLQKFYKYILNQEDLNEKKDLIIGEDNYGIVEFRPTNKLGVKLPLGINFNNKTDKNNYCYFCDYSKSLRRIKDPLHITKIKKMDNILFRLILDKIFDIKEEKQVSTKNITDYKETKEAHNPLPQYDQNVDEKITIEAIQDLIETGLTRTGTRWKSLINIAKYYKHLEVSREDCKEWITEWMNQQDKNCYTTKWTYVLKDINNIIEYVYTHEFNLVGGVKTVRITYAEIKEILKAKSKNEKLVLYSMLIHSKRYARKSGVFYFPYSLMMLATSLTRMTLIKIVNNLAENNFIEIVSRNTAIEHKFMKEPNKYRVTLNVIEVVEVDDKSFEFTEGDNYLESFNNCIINSFENKEIKQLCGRRFYEDLMDYKNNIIKVKV
jgi:hypothetical protein